MATSYEKFDRTVGSQNAVSGAVETLSDAASKVQKQAGEQIDKQLDNLSSSIRSNPLQAAAIAAGIGFLFAVIARR